MKTTSEIPLDEQILRNKSASDFSERANVLFGDIPTASRISFKRGFDTAYYYGKQREAKLKAKLEKAIGALNEIKSIGYYRTCSECDGGEHLYDEAVEALGEIEGVGE